MPVSQPDLPKDIQIRLGKYTELLKSSVAENHVDGTVTLAGFLRNNSGAKLIISNLEELNGDEIDFWKQAAYESGARYVNYTADFGAGKIVFDVEYKSQYTHCEYCEWLIYPIIVTILTLSLKIV